MDNQCVTTPAGQKIDGVCFTAFIDVARGNNNVLAVFFKDQLYGAHQITKIGAVQFRHQ